MPFISWQLAKINLKILTYCSTVQYYVHSSITGGLHMPKIQVRISEEVDHELGKAIQLLKSDNPAVEVTRSSIARAALEEWLRKYLGQKPGL